MPGAMPGRRWLGSWRLAPSDRTLAQGERVSYPIPGKLRGSGKYSRGLRKSGGLGWLEQLHKEEGWGRLLLRRRARKEGVVMNHRAAQPVRDPTGLIPA